MAEWSLDINVAGVKAAGVLPARIDEEGVYSVIIKDSEKKTSAKGNEGVLFTCEVTEAGKYSGFKSNVWVSTKDLDKPNSFSRKHWRALMENVIKNPSTLENGIVKTKSEHYKEKKAFVYLKPGDRDDVQMGDDGKKIYPPDNGNFITAAEYGEYKKSHGGGKAATAAKGNGAANGATKPESTPTPPPEAAGAEADPFAET